MKIFTEHEIWSIHKYAIDEDKCDKTKYVKVDDVVARLKDIQKHKYFTNTEINELLNEFKEFKELKK